MVEVKHQFAYLTGVKTDLIFTGKGTEYTVDRAKVTNAKGRRIPDVNHRKYQHAVLTVPDSPGAHVINAMIHEDSPGFFEPILPIEVIRENCDFRGFSAARVIKTSERGIYDAILVGYVEWLIRNKYFQSRNTIGQIDTIERQIRESEMVKWTVRKFEGSGGDPAWSQLQGFISDLHHSQGSSYLPPSSDPLRSASLFGVSLTLHTSDGPYPICQQHVPRPHIDAWVGEQYILLLYRETQALQLPFDIWTRLPTLWSPLLVMMLEMVMDAGNWISLKSYKLFQQVFDFNSSQELWRLISRVVNAQANISGKFVGLINLCSSCCEDQVTKVIACGCKLCVRCYAALSVSMLSASSAEFTHSCGLSIPIRNSPFCQICGEENRLISTFCDCRVCFFCAISNVPNLLCRRCGQPLPPESISLLTRNWNLKRPFQTCAVCHLELFSDQNVEKLKCRHRIHAVHLGRRKRIFCVFCQKYVNRDPPEIR